MIDDADTDRDVVKWMLRNFAPTRDALLRQHPWNFALVRAELTAEVTAPAFGWRYAYALPAGCLRFIPPTFDGDFEGAAVPYAIEGGKVLTNQSSPLRVRYVGQITDPSKFDALFTQCLAASLAMKAANWITRKQSYAERMTVYLRETMASAQLIDALETFPERPEGEHWIDARFSGVLD